MLVPRAQIFSLSNCEKKNLLFKPHSLWCYVVVVQSPRRVWRFATPWTAVHQASLSLTISPSMPKFMSIASAMPSNHLILWCPLLLLSSIFASTGTFPKSWLFISENQNTKASVLPISIQVWSPLRLTCLISLLSKGLSGVFSSTGVLRHQFLWHSAFFTVELSQLYMTNGKTIALTYGPLLVE